jgi:hypothetical protein
MDIQHTANGKYQTTFNGVVIPCNTSNDCPGSCECHINVKWVDSPHCGGQLSYGRIGLTCDELGHYAVEPLVFSILSFIVAFFIFTISLWLILSLIQSSPQKGKKKFTNLWNQVVFNSLIFVSLATLGTMVRDGIFCGLVTGSIPLHYIPPSNAKDYTSGYGNIAFAVSYVFVNFAALTVGLSWIDLSGNISRLSMKSVRTIYATVIKVYFALVIVALIILFAAGKDSFVIYIALPSVVWMAIVYLIGGWKMRVTLMDALRSTASSKLEEVLARTLRLIQYTAVAISFTLVVVLILLIVNVSIPSDDKNKPDYPLNWLLNRPAYLLMTVIDGIVLAYCYPLVQKQINKWQMDGGGGGGLGGGAVSSAVGGVTQQQQQQNQSNKSPGKHTVDGTASSGNKNNKVESGNVVAPSA